MSGDKGVTTVDQTWQDRIDHGAKMSADASEKMAREILNDVKTSNTGDLKAKAKDLDLQPDNGLSASRVNEAVDRLEKEQGMLEKNGFPLAVSIYGSTGSVDIIANAQKNAQGDYEQHSYWAYGTHPNAIKTGDVINIFEKLEPRKRV